MEYLPINDLPNELLELIFDQLDVDDLKHASLVCKRWSDLAFSGQRMNRVTLVLRKNTHAWDKELLQSNRKHRHLVLWETKENFAYVKELFQTFNVSSLRILDYYLSHSSLRLILLEIPNLQHLSIYYEPDEMYQMIEPLPVMRKMERLEIRYNFSKKTIPWHTIAPSLRCLKMYCESEEQLEQWRLFSGQLKQVYVTSDQVNLLTRFCEMTFPLLKELTMTSKFRFERHEHDLFTRHEFFRRNTSLRLICLAGIYIFKTLVRDITNHSKKLTYLGIIGKHGREFEENGEPGSLESLCQLTELKHLRLENLKADIFYGCEALTSLQSLSISCIEFGRKRTLGFLKDLFQIAPQLRCLEFGYFTMREKAVQFICNNFSKLTHLQLTYSVKVSRDCFSKIDRLPHLWYLELRLSETGRLSIGIIPSNNVRCLTLHLYCKYDEDDLLRLPKSFLQLERLNLVCSWSHENLHEPTVDRLRQVFPTCAIKIYGPVLTDTRQCRSYPTWQRDKMMPVFEECILKNHI